MTTHATQHFSNRIERAYATAADVLSAARDALLESEIRGDASDKSRAVNDRHRLIEDIVRSHDTMERITEARRRVEDGTFGICIDCGKQIPERRLAALPWSERCVSCQDLVERRENQVQ